jgi:methylthioribose-1-phosphate isomerase
LTLHFRWDTIRGMQSPIEWQETQNGPVVRMLDQSRLPSELVWVDCRDVQTVAKGIKALWIRGAPAIGIAAAMGVALGASRLSSSTASAFAGEMKTVFDVLGATRPTAVNLFWALRRMERMIQSRPNAPVEDLKQFLVKEALAIQNEEIDRNRKMGEHGAKLIRDGNTVLTHCNTGPLATGGHGTALGVIFTAFSQGKKIHVLADETRPVLQGARLTMWELQQEGVPCTLITDNMAGAMMKNGRVNLCIVGADRIASNGDTANKIGTYSVAVLAAAHRIPFYVAAPSSTVDFSIETGAGIPIEERNPEEVTTVMGKIRIAPEDVAAANPAFDVTPARYIKGIITEQGVIRPGDLQSRLKQS